MALLLFLLALSLLVLVLLRAERAAHEAIVVAEVPLLRADTGPMRERPADPGGMAVPHRDKLVYDALEAGTVEPVVERLLPPPEEPLPRPTPPEPQVAPAIAAMAPPPPPPAAEPSPELTAPLSPPPPPVPVTVAADPIETALALAAEVPADPLTGWRVQVGAYRSPEEAAAGWLSATGRAPALLEPLHHFIARVDLGEPRGVYHRLHVGPLAGRQAANSLCNQLKAAGMDCFVVAP